MMKSSFIFYCFYILNHIPDWKKNIKQKQDIQSNKNFSVPPLQSGSSSGTLTGLHSTWQLCCSIFQLSLILFQSNLFPLQMSFTFPLLFTARGKTFQVRFFFPFLWPLEAVGVEDRIRHPSLFRVFWHRLSLPFVPCLPRSSCQKFRNSYSTTGFLARIQNALNNTCTACARKQIWRETWSRFSSSRFKSQLDDTVKIKRMWVCLHCVQTWLSDSLAYYLYRCVLVYVY